MESSGFGLREAFRSSCSVGLLREDRLIALAIRPECHSQTVVGPDGVLTVAAQRELPRGRRACQVDDPDIRLLVVCGNGSELPVWGDSREGIGSRRHLQPLEFVARAVPV